MPVSAARSQPPRPSHQPSSQPRDNTAVLQGARRRTSSAARDTTAAFKGSQAINVNGGSGSEYEDDGLSSSSEATSELEIQESSVSQVKKVRLRTSLAMYPAPSTLSLATAVGQITHPNPRPQDGQTNQADRGCGDSSKGSERSKGTGRCNQGMSLAISFMCAPIEHRFRPSRPPRRRKFASRT